MAVRMKDRSGALRVPLPSVSYSSNANDTFSFTAEEDKKEGVER